MQKLESASLFVNDKIVRANVIVQTTLVIYSKNWLNAEDLNSGWMLMWQIYNNNNKDLDKVIKRNIGENLERTLSE